MADRFVYVTYIESDLQKVWDALTKPEFTRQYWVGTTHRTSWKKGEDWALMIPDGRVGDSGKILEIDPPRRLVVSWRNEFQPGMREEGYSRASFDLAQDGDMVKLIVIHEMDKDGSKLIEAVSNGWPRLLACMKTLLETGRAPAGADKWPEGV